MTTAGRQRLGVVARGDREIVITRVFNAPRRLVFDAWTKPELFVRWMGGRGFTVPICEMDVRPGGAYRYVLRREDGAGQEMTMRGEYREVVPPQRLVTAEAWEGFAETGWRPEDRTVTTALFVESADRKTTWSATLLYPTQAVRDAALNMQPAWSGMAEGLDRMEALLAELA
jgi:uncharacterized protein YndB with AHSA1/START domain